MVNVLKKVLFLTAAFALTLSCEAAGGGEVLWWMIGENYGSITGTTEDGKTMFAGDLGVTDARIGYQDASGNRTYLTLYGLDDEGTVHVLEGAAGVGLPAEYFADLSGISDLGYSFVLELGHWEEDSGWVATSMEASATYQELVAGKHISNWDNTSPTYGTPWTPSNFSVVPEPSSGLMVLVGTALLMLRRKRFGREA
jgi:hypothetical protein